MWYDVKENSVDFFINARPASSKNVIVGVYDDALKIKVKAPAVEGAANKELIKFLAKLCKVPKSEVLFVSGETSKRKRIRLPRNARVEALIDRYRE